MRALYRTLAATSVLVACEAETAPVSAPPVASSFEIRDVVDAALAGRPADATPATLTSEARADVEGLAVLVASDPSMLEIAHDDVARIGSGAWSVLEEIARAGDRSDAERTAAVDVLACGEPGAAEALARLLVDVEPAWVRARAAYHLSVGGPDHLIPQLLLRLRYETDHESVVWIACALARHGNLAGLDGLMAVASDAASSAQPVAARELARLVAERGLADATELWDSWRRSATERGFPTEPRSDALRLTIVKWIARFSEFQLRGVDDARFLFERMDATAAEELAKALHDDDVYVRVHAAQSLQRMGRRAQAAGSALIEALAEPELAPHAAEALGHIGFADAEPALVDRLGEETPLGLRLACARALGHVESMGASRAEEVLGPLLDAEPIELAQAAAESLLRRDPARSEVALRVAAFTEDPRVDPGSSERTLREWLADTGATEALARWDELAAPAKRAESREETRARRASRGALIRSLATP